MESVGRPGWMYGEEALNNSIRGLQNGTLRGAPAVKMVPYAVHPGENGTLRGAPNAKWYPKRCISGPKMVPYAVHPDQAHRIT